MSLGRSSEIRDRTDETEVREDKTDKPEVTHPIHERAPREGEKPLGRGHYEMA